MKKIPACLAVILLLSAMMSASADLILPGQGYEPVYYSSRVFTKETFLSLGVSLVLTLAIEVTAAMVSGRRRKALLIVALVNILTNPIVVLTVRAIPTLSRLHAGELKVLITAIMEGLAFFVEALFYRDWKKFFPNPWRFSLIANGLSFLIGLIINLLI